MSAFHSFDTHLNLSKDFTGSLERISTTTSSGKQLLRTFILLLPLISIISEWKNLGYFRIDGTEIAAVNISGSKGLICFAGIENGLGLDGLNRMYDLDL